MLHRRVVAIGYLNSVEIWQLVLLELEVCEDAEFNFKLICKYFGYFQLHPCFSNVIYTTYSHTI